MKQRIGKFAFVLWIAVAGTSASARISTAPSPIEDRFEKSDIVCICIVREMAQTKSHVLTEGKLAPTDYEASIRVVQMLKGEPQPEGARVAFSGLDPLLGPPLQNNFKYLLFLRQRQADEFQLADKDGAIAIPADVDLEGPSGGLDSFQAALVRGVKSHANDPEGINLMNVLLQFQKLSDPTVSELQSLTYRPLSRLAVLSLEALCRASQEPAKYVPQLIATLVDYNAKAPSELAHLGPELSEIGDIIADDTTGAEIEGLERLTNSQANVLRVCAMLAIRRLRSPDTIPFLVTALDSDYDMVQYEALMTLSEITGKTGEFSPGKGLFDQNPVKYKGMWKDWYQRQHGSVGKDAQPQ